tara:strand:+ start:80 stop:667 length:588 start_codon:yes stop_codon:yes gene_type:complete
METAALYIKDAKGTAMENAGRKRKRTEWGKLTTNNILHSKRKRVYSEPQYSEHLVANIDCGQEKDGQAEHRATNVEMKEKESRGENENVGEENKNIIGGKKKIPGKKSKLIPRDEEEPHDTTVIKSSKNKKATEVLVTDILETKKSKGNEKFDLFRHASLMFHPSSVPMSLVCREQVRSPLPLILSIAFLVDRSI